MIDTRVADLLEAPDAKLVIERAQTILANEAQRRRAFREWLRDDVKAEFINGEVVMHSPVKRRHLDASKYLENLLQNFVCLMAWAVSILKRLLLDLLATITNQTFVFGTAKRRTHSRMTRWST